MSGCWGEQLPDFWERNVLPFLEDSGCSAVLDLLWSSMLQMFSAGERAGLQTASAAPRCGSASFLLNCAFLHHVYMMTSLQITGIQYSLSALFLCTKTFLCILWIFPWHYALNIMKKYSQPSQFHIEVYYSKVKICSCRFLQIGETLPL